MARTEEDNLNSEIIPLIIIGIAGASASGKSLLLKSILKFLNPQKVAHFDLDGYHSHTREERRQLNEYPDEIRANCFEKVICNLKRLMEGKPVDIRVYEHKKGIFLPPIRLVPKRILFVEGLHSCMINNIANQTITNLTVFLYPNEDLRKSWKVKRDVQERDYSYSEALEQIAHREPFVAKYIFPQIDTSDIVIYTPTPENIFPKHQLLLSLSFHENNLVDKSIKKQLLDFFAFRKVDFNNSQFIAVNLRKDKIDTLQEKIFGLGLKSFYQPQPECEGTDSYSEIAKILSILILTFLGRSR